VGDLLRLPVLANDEILGLQITHMATSRIRHDRIHLNQVYRDPQHWAAGGR
jgi:hypothetical protein